MTYTKVSLSPLVRAYEREGWKAEAYSDEDTEVVLHRPTRETMTVTWTAERGVESRYTPGPVMHIYYCTCPDGACPEHGEDQS